jgi:hypothetical protein
VTGDKWVRVLKEHFFLLDLTRNVRKDQEEKMGEKVKFCKKRKEKKRSDSLMSPIKSLST